MDDTISKIQWLHKLRKAEIEQIIKFFPSDKNSKILEVGGGDGFQAKIVAELGYEVTSIDTNPKLPNYHEVLKANISLIDYQSETFDVIFSSHVLPHIKNLDCAFIEMKRVLRKDGIIIHIVPTSWWSLVTNFWHYILIPKKMWIIIKSDKGKSNKNNSNESQNNSRKKSTKLINYLLLHPLGENPSFLHEFFYFSDKYWQELFKKNGFVIKQKGNCPLLYSGYGVFKMKLQNLRKTLANYSVTSSRYYITNKS